MEKQTVTATFPGIGKVEISKERAEQIRNLQKIIRERKKLKVYGVVMTELENMMFSKWVSNEGIAMNTKSEDEQTKITSDWMKKFE